MIQAMTANGDGEQDGETERPYKCAICGESFGTLGGAKAHVTNSEDADHADREGNEPGAVEIEGLEELRKMNERASKGQVDGLLTETDLRVFKEVARHPDANQSVIAENAGVSPGQPPATFNKVAAEWGDRKGFVKELLPHIEPEDGEDDDVEHVRRIPDDAEDEDIELGVNYIAVVNNIKDYGVFVSLNDARPDVSGLVHRSNMPDGTSPTWFSVGQPVVVKPITRDEQGIGFKLVERNPDDLDRFDVPDARTGAPSDTPSRSRYSGPDTGIDTTSGEPEQTITERPTATVQDTLDDDEVEELFEETVEAEVMTDDEDDDTLTAELTVDDAFALLIGDGKVQARKRLFEELID